MREVRAVFFLVKMSNLSLSSLISVSSRLMVLRRVLMTSSFLLVAPPIIKLCLISLSSLRSSSFSCLRIMFSFSKLLTGEKASAKVLLLRMLAVSFRSRLLCATCSVSSCLRGEGEGDPRECSRFFRVARMAAGKRDYRWPGETL
jgi:hypothetical protein